MTRASLTCLWTLGVAAVAGAQPCPRAGLPAYAHNDYEHRRPLADALALGFRGVEADVFLVDGALRVGHDRRRARRGGTLDALYLAPLAALGERCGALTSDGRPFLLTVEIKERSPATFDSLLALLGRRREMLERGAAAGGVGPAVEVVLVGWHPAPGAMPAAAAGLVGVQHRITRRDGVVPSGDTAETAAPSVRLLSLDYGKTIGRPWVGRAGRRRWLDALRRAKAASPARLLRVYDVPADSAVYSALFAAGVDLIGTKRLDTTRRLLAPPGR